MNLQTFLKIVKPYTMTSDSRITALYSSLEYIRLNNIQGDIVECGVWKGGNILGCIEYLKHYNIEKKIWLYDTFEGMTEVSEFDIDHMGVSGKIWENKCESSLDEVKKIISTSTYNSNLINYVKGDVLLTLDVNENIPHKISLLRLDTDWYESTKKEMEILYPKLIENGVLIVDDYGHWKGAKKAVDDFFGADRPIMETIDYTGIKIIKK